MTDSMLLLVDDHRLFRDGMTLLLHQLDAGARIVEAATAGEALEKLAGVEIDLALIDYQLPDMTGVELLKQVKQRSPATPVVMMSGLEDSQIVRAALAAGASGFLPKALEPGEMLDAIALVLGGGFYVPPFVVDRLDQAGSSRGNLAELAELAQRMIGEQATRNIDSEAGELIERALNVMEREREQLKQFAFYDELTQLPNRRLFGDRLQQAQRHARRERRAMALVLLDVDDFKAVNDSLGHPAGDALLQMLAERLRQGCREVDTACRLGGDEFALVLSDVDNREALQVTLARLIEQLRQPFVWAGQQLPPAVSMGAVLDAGGESMARLIERADAALYRAKRAGKNQFSIADDGEATR